MRVRRLLPWSLPAAAVLACGAYWAHLLDEQAQARERALAHAAARAARLADTLALQTETLLQSTDFVLRTLAGQWSGNERQALAPLPFPAGAVLTLGVLDAKGRLHDPDGRVLQEGVEAVPVADARRLAVGAPARQPAAAVSFARALPDRAGQVQMTLSPDYLAGLLRRLQPTRADLLLLVRPDGVVVARSDALVENLPFSPAPLFERPPRAGEVLSQPWSAGGPRILGWERAGDGPLLALAAVDEALTLRPLQAEQAAVRWRATMGSGVLALLAAVATALSVKALRRRERRDAARAAAAAAAAPPPAAGYAGPDRRRSGMLPINRPVQQSPAGAADSAAVSRDASATPLG